MKNCLRILGLLVILAGLFFVFKSNILKGVGSLLISEDQFERAEIAFVLGGNSLDRGNEAALLLSQNRVDKVVCLGENVPHVLKALNIFLMESEISQNAVLLQNDDSNKVSLLPLGTSTKEEVEAIVTYCEKNNIKSAAIVSDRFHTSRINRVVGWYTQNSTTEFYIHGAPSSLYNEDLWWENEYGLIMVNNEYVKTIYYLLKY